MPNRHKLRVRNVVFPVLLVATTVLARPPADPVTQKTDDETLAQEFDFETASRLSAAEQTAESMSYQKKMVAIKDRIQKLAKKARADKDIIRLNCVNDKLKQLQAIIDMTKVNLTSMQDAIKRQDSEGRTHEFVKIKISYEKALVLEQEAEACIGEDISYAGDTDNQTDVDPDIPEEDPTEEPMAPIPMDRLPMASPYL